MPLQPPVDGGIASRYPPAAGGLLGDRTAAWKIGSRPACAIMVLRPGCRAARQVRRSTHGSSRVSGRPGPRPDRRAACQFEEVVHRRPGPAAYHPEITIAPAAIRRLSRPIRRGARECFASGAFGVTKAQPFSAIFSDDPPEDGEPYSTRRNSLRDRSIGSRHRHPYAGTHRRIQHDQSILYKPLDQGIFGAPTP